MIAADLVIILGLVSVALAAACVTLYFRIARVTNERDEAWKIVHTNLQAVADAKSIKHERDMAFRCMATQERELNAYRPFVQKHDPELFARVMREGICNVKAPAWAGEMGGKR